ncbi:MULTISPECIES: hypothetical protein [Nitratireductor]|uniref:hypothetical protein n=1 Tax=Nitratireductor TaxID=245876 RepID=UPI000D0D49DA|nr:MULTISPECIES: hypothetical protein [Nitratireductor]PSM18105.1 hypothetical protein C7T96_09490 [Nitratireductor sp. StC3]
MRGPDLTVKYNRLVWHLAAERVRRASSGMRSVIKANPNWHLQPRAPAGTPEGGQWIAYLTAGAASILPVLMRLGPKAVRLFREIARRVGPTLRRLPKQWGEKSKFPDEEEFDTETRRIGPMSRQRPGQPVLRFRNERELRNYLGPAGPGREWHHIVEKRLEVLFSPELIHSTDNIINLPVDLHRHINGKMSRKSSATNDIVRRFYVSRFSFRDQYNHGIDLIREAAEELGYDPDNL